VGLVHPGLHLRLPLIARLRLVLLACHRRHLRGYPITARFPDSATRPSPD
jgi:hypothetical protein